MNITKTITQHTIDQSKVSEGDRVAFRTEPFLNDVAPMHGVVTSVKPSHITIDNNKGTSYRIPPSDLINGRAIIENVWQQLYLTDEELITVLTALEKHWLDLDSILSEYAEKDHAVDEKLAQQHGNASQVFNDLYLMVHRKRT